MKKIWQEFKSFIKMISKGKKDVAVVMAAGGFMKATVPFLVFYFSAQILNNAIEGDYEACVKSVAALLLSQFVCELVNRFCQKRIEVLGESCQQIIRQQMADKAFELQYEKFEKQETLDALRHAKLTAGGSGDIKDQVDTCYQIFVQFFSMCYSVVFFLLLLLKIDAEQKKTFFVSYGSTLLLIGLYAVVVIVNLYLGKILSAKQYEFIHANDHNNALGGYLAGIMTDERNSKDIRLYDLSKLFLGKFRQMVEGYSIYLQMGKVNGKYRGMIEGINQFAAGTAYLLAGMKALNGMIDIGNVILYAGVISQTVSGHAYLLRVEGLLAGMVICMAIFYKNQKNRPYRRTFLDLFREFDLSSARNRWYIKLTFIVSSAMLVMSLLGLPRAMWAGIACMSVCLPFTDDCMGRAEKRGLFNIVGSLIFVALYLVLPESMYPYIGMIGGIGVGYSAGYAWQTAFNTFGAMLSGGQKQKRKPQKH